MSSPNYEDLYDRVFALVDDPYDPVDEDQLGEFLTEKRVARFLKHNDTDYGQTASHLAETWQWRQRTKPETVECPLCAVDATSHSMRPVGFDAAGRLMIYGCFATSTDRVDREAQLKHCIRLFEDTQALIDSKSDASGAVIFVDYLGYEMSTADLGVMQGLLPLFRHYPDVVEQFFFYDVPPTMEIVLSWSKSLLLQVSSIFAAPKNFVVLQAFETYEKLPEACLELGTELLEWLKQETDEHRSSSGPRKEWWERGQSSTGHDGRGTRSFVESWDYGAFLGPSEQRQITVSSLVQGRLGLKLKRLQVSGFEESIAEGQWRIHDEIIAINDQEVHSVSEFKTCLGVAIQNLPVVFTVERRL